MEPASDGPIPARRSQLCRWFTFNTRNTVNTSANANQGAPVRFVCRRAVAVPPASGPQTNIYGRCLAAGRLDIASSPQPSAVLERAAPAALVRRTPAMVDDRVLDTAKTVAAGGLLIATGALLAPGRGRRGPSARLSGDHHGHPDLTAAGAVAGRSRGQAGCRRIERFTSRSGRPNAADTWATVNRQPGSGARLAPRPRPAQPASSTTPFTT